MIAPDGQFWGTRHLVPLLPLACVGVACLGRPAKHFAIAVTLIAAISQAPNLVSYPERPQVEVGLDSPAAWDVHRLTLVDVWPAAARQIRDARRTIRPPWCAPSLRGGCCASWRSGGGCCRSSACLPSSASA